MKTYYTGEVHDYIRDMLGDDWELVAEELVTFKGDTFLFTYQFINPDTGKWESFHEVAEGEWKHMNRRVRIIH